MRCNTHMTVIYQRTVGLHRRQVKLARLYMDGSIGISTNIPVAVNRLEEHLLRIHAQHGISTLVLECGLGGGQLSLFFLQFLDPAVRLCQL